MFKVGIVTNKGRIEAKDFDNREEVDNYILSFDGSEIVTHYRILENGKVVETELGKQ
jgi:hypothetical protein